MADAMRDPAGTERARRQSRRRSRSAPMTRAASGALAAVVAAAALGGCGSSRSAEEVLSSANAFVGAATSVHFGGTLETTATDLVVGSSTDGGRDGEGPGTTTIDRMTIDGAWTPDAWESTTEDTWGTSQLKVFGSTAYLRDVTDQPDAQWQTMDMVDSSPQELAQELAELREQLGPDELASMDADLAAVVYLGGGTLNGLVGVGNPSGLFHVVEQLHEVRSVSEDGDVVTLEGEISAPADVVEAWGAPLPVGSVTVEVEGDGAIERLRLSVGDGDDRFEIDVRFSEWNVPTALSQPNDEDIDQTPWIDEAGVSAVTGISLLRPTAVPPGWTLDYVEVMGAEDSMEGCDQVELYWSEPYDEPVDVQSGGGYIDVYLLPAGCAQAYDATPFEVGPFAPLPSRQGSYTAELLVGDTVVQIDTTLDGPELAALVASLAPTDVDALSADLASGATVLTS